MASRARLCRTIENEEAVATTPSRKRVRQTRSAERTAVAAVQQLLDGAGLIFQPIDGANDIGKDAYVDLTSDGEVTGEVIALQIKGGTSYQRANGYAIPCSASDAELWRSSSVPIFGVVHDPDTGKLHTANLTAWARSSGASAIASAAPVDDAFSLNERTLPDFVTTARDYVQIGRGPVLFDLVQDDVKRQRAAVFDAFAIGRHDWRALRLLRATMFRLDPDDALPIAVGVLTHVVGHGDIFWHSGNWLAPDVCARVEPTLRWDRREATALIAAAGSENWGRGSLGQCVAALLYADPDWRQVLRETVRRAPELEVAWIALLLLVDDAGRGGAEVFSSLLAERPALADHELAPLVTEQLDEFGSVSFW